MITVHVGDADRVNLLHRDLVFPDIRLNPFSSVQQYPLPLPTHCLRGWRMLQGGCSGTTAEYDYIKLHSASNVRIALSVLDDDASGAHDFVILVGNEVKSVGPVCCIDDQSACLI